MGSSVKNLIKVFQLDTVDRIEVTPPPPTPASTPAREVWLSTSKTECDLPDSPYGTIKPHYRDTLALPYATIKTIGTLGSRRKNGTIRQTPLSQMFSPPITPEEEKTSVTFDPVEERSVGDEKAIRLLEALLPHAAHLIPLPGSEEEDADLLDTIAQEELISALECGDMEIVVSAVIS
jgi:hypothetical protein